MNNKKLFYSVIIGFVFLIGLIYYKVNLLSEKNYNIIDNNLVTDSSYNFHTENLTKNKVNQIRSTGNTNISGRTGKIYYLSNSGDDNNDGLSISRPWKSLAKLESAFNDNIINSGDTILFNDGDMFRGNIKPNKPDITFGSYGDISKGKPTINGSLYNGAIEGEWTMVAPNIWKYTINGEPIKRNVGVIWGFCKEGNNNCTDKIDNYPLSFSYAKLITTLKTYDETNLDIASILKNDLEFYQTGHTQGSTTIGGDLYLYSTINPKNRYDDIEFALGGHTIRINSNTDCVIDNLKLVFTGSHGVGAGTVANLKVTNCEIGFIGGAIHSYNESNNATRYGNAVEIYGSVMPTKGYEVKEGFVIDNCYVYEVFDAGLTFQFTTDKETDIDRAIFINNVVEYCNYNVEYWNTSESTDPSVYENSYIKEFLIKNNIMRYAGYGVSQTRNNRGNACHLRSWYHGSGNNRVNGSYIIENNIFDTAQDMFMWLTADEEEYLPTIRNNVFNNAKFTSFGYFFENYFNKINYPYDVKRLAEYFPNNTFLYKATTDNNQYSGKTGDLNWSYDVDSETLTIDGEGRMADYTQSSLPVWSNYSNYIKKIVIGEKVTHLGTYAFYNLKYVDEIVINSINLEDFSKESSNVGNNFTFYNTGNGWFGIKLTFGPKVTVIPAMLTWPGDGIEVSPNITNIVFQGNLITKIKTRGLAGFRGSILKIPEGVEEINGFSVGNMHNLKILELPESLKTLTGWSIADDTALAKIVMGKNITIMGGSMFFNDYSLKEVVIPSTITYNTVYPNLFSNKSVDTIVYGNDSIKKIVDDYSENTSTSNIKYSNLSNYKIKVTSNGSITSSSNTNYGDKYDFKINVDSNHELVSVRAYEYYDINNTRYIIDNVQLNKNNDIYSISNLRNDVYVDVTLKSKAVIPSDNTPHNDVIIPNKVVDNTSTSKDVIIDGKIIIPTSETDTKKDTSNEKSKTDILDVIKEIIPTGSDELDVFTENPGSDDSNESKSNKGIFIVIGIVVVSIFSIIFIILKAKKDKEKSLD